MRTTEFAPALPPSHEYAPTPPTSPLASGYAPPATATSKDQLATLPGPTFLSKQMARCGALLGAHWSRMNTEERVDGSLRVVYGASIRSCRPFRCASSANGVAAPQPNHAR